MTVGAISPSHIVLMTMQSFPDRFDLNTRLCLCRSPEPGSHCRGSPGQGLPKGGWDKPSLFACGENTSLGNEEDILDFKTQEMKIYLENIVGNSLPPDQAQQFHSCQVSLIHIVRMLVFQRLDCISLLLFYFLLDIAFNIFLIIIFFFFSFS